MFYHGTQTMDKSRIWCSMSKISKTLCSHFSGQGSYYSYTHTWTKLHNEVMSWIFGAYECHYAWPLPEANSTTVCDLTVPYHLWTACPCLSWSTVAIVSRSISMELDSEGLKTFSLACMHPFIQFKFLVYGYTVVDIYTNASCNAVSLVWGSLMLTPKSNL